MTDAESTQQEVEAVPQRFNGRVQGRLGYVCVGVPWFDVESAEVAAAATMESLATDWEIVGSPRVLTRCDQADEAMRLIAGMNVDCLVLEVGTFPDGDVIASIATKAHVPIVIHYVPDTFQDGLVERNAMCGAAPVSYTHLDVYKRQPGYWPTVRPTLRSLGKDFSCRPAMADPTSTG